MVAMGRKGKKTIARIVACEVHHISDTIVGNINAFSYSQALKKNTRAQA
jgi:hypothetical protein